MENQKHTPDPNNNDEWLERILGKQNLSQDASPDDDWLDRILGKQNVPRELGPDELSMAAAGLTHPDELDLERIVQESIAENWGAEDPAVEEYSNETPLEKKAKSRQTSKPKATPAPTPEAPTSEEEGDSPTVLRKLRPKAKDVYGFWGVPHILATVVWAAIILFVGVSLGRLAWVCAADLLALGKEPQSVTITIAQDDDFSDVAKKLEKSGMIRYANLFETFAKLTGKGKNILVGSITFDGSIVYDYNALINAMSYKGGSTVTVEVMIPEGYNCAQIFALLEEKGVCTAKALEEYAADGELDDYWFLRDVERGSKYCLEGFLFPDTYEFYMDDEPERVLTKFLDDFDYRFSQRLIDKFAALNQKLGLNLTIQEVVTMASIIEKETANNAESYNISSVFYNRLVNASAYPFLNSDATILYATDYLNKGELTTDALINASPYNTYTQTGLPPTPIANPGLNSLDAALDPADTNYYYFILDKEANAHRFSQTLAQHEQLRKELGYLS